MGTLEVKSDTGCGNVRRRVYVCRFIYSINGELLPFQIVCVSPSGADSNCESLQVTHERKVHVCRNLNPAVIFAPVSSIYEIVGVVQSRYISAQILKNRPKSDIYVKGAYVWTRTRSEYSSSLVYATRLQTFQYNMIF